MLYKETKKLFRGIYQYKIVLICSGASMFRNGDMSTTLEFLKKVDITKNDAYPRYSTKIRTQDELDYALALSKQISKMKDFELRVESPWISIYTNNKKDVDALSKIDADCVKYICMPPTNTVLEEGIIIMPKMPFDYRVTLGKTTTEHSTFIQWAEGNKKLKLTKSTKKELSKSRSWGGTYFYVSGDNNMLMVKMHLGGSINKVERIIKA